MPAGSQPTGGFALYFVNLMLKLKPLSKRSEGIESMVPTTETLVM
jgi:hypothetical protein